MKKIFLLLVGLMLVLPFKAQNDLTIGLIMPDQEVNGIRPDAYNLLRSKLEKMLTSCGVSAFESDFMMYPTVNIIEENLIEGGIKNFFKVKIELTLNVANLTSETLFGSESLVLVGSAERIRSDAVRNAFSQIRGNDPHFKAFVERTKSKIYDYYAANKNAILTKASTLASTGDYEQALALLSNYPSQVAGYNEAQTLMSQIYLQYINANAAQILNEARAAYAVKDYEHAVNLAAQIDPESSYYNDARSIINQVRNTINKEQAAEHQRAMRALEIAADVEKTRVKAAASVARAYYGRTVVNNYSYTSVANFVRIY